MPCGVPCMRDPPLLGVDSWLRADRPVWESWVGPWRNHRYTSYSIQWHRWSFQKLSLELRSSIWNFPRNPWLLHVWWKWHQIYRFRVRKECKIHQRTWTGAPTHLLQSYYLHQERSIFDISFIGRCARCSGMPFLPCPDRRMWLICIFGQELLPSERPMPCEFFRSI
jgi:hypothetical protein